MRCEGRWHRKGQEFIYASEHYGTAMLEKLAHYNGILPPNQHFITIDVPAGISFEAVTKDSLPGWDDLEGAASRVFGAAWIDEARSGILFVPSVVSREESNVLINPWHPDAARIRPGREQWYAGTSACLTTEARTMQPAGDLSDRTLLSINLRIVSLPYYVTEPGTLRD
jgi:hypothetical protein